MTFQTPQNKCSLEVHSLGKVDGWHYADGVEQYCGIPYADLPKRWTRSELKTSWPNKYHDGTQLGNNCPRARASGSDSSPINPFIPVPPNPAFTKSPISDEKTALILNIATAQQPSTEPAKQKLPVFVWIHGGSLLFGSANYGIYDTTRTGGFLAGAKIAEELKRDGFAGNGNFGFTDQKVALDWVHRYIENFGGDSNNVTVVGQSAGGVSIGHHMASNHPMKFHRAICMSGVGTTLSAMSLEDHENLFESTCRFFDIDSLAPDALDRLRQVDQQVLADADHIIQGVPAGTGNPCLDGWFYAHDPQVLTESPTWVKSFMFGDVHDEGIIFILNLRKDTYNTVRATLMKHVQDEDFLNSVFSEYGISPDLTQNVLLERVCTMAADAVFKIKNYQSGIVNNRLREEGALFEYHFDQRSRIRNTLLGKSYHGFDVIYLFRNLDTELNEAERAMGTDLQNAWLRFVHGQAPWEKEIDTSLWMIWGPDSQQKLETEEQDEPIRHYSRFKRVISLGSGGLWRKYLKGLDALVMKRENAGKFEKEEIERV
ncbi:Alpha/Beta hydrolase protein [Penicillium longicatenatum]|nr:Alpha/Beta hydrolase protein [Penicillium longicatenatum]